MSEFFPYGMPPGSPIDDVCMLLNGLGKRCVECKNPTQNKWLKGYRCPICRGEKVEGNRYYGKNGGQLCDTHRGPCSCGAWH